MKQFRHAILILLALIFFQETGLGQDAGYRPGLFFREDWKETPAEIPLSQDHVNNPNLILSIYGPGKDSIKKSHHDAPPDDPYYIWSGLCLGNWAVTLKHKDHLADLSGYAKIKWRSKQFGFRELHIILKLSDGTWLVSQESDPVSADWRIREFNVQDLHWYTIDMSTITELKPVPDPDLSEVEEIGFTDLMPGGRSSACSRLDWLEVYAYLVREKSN
jgi:hypothetical protein